MNHSPTTNIIKTENSSDDIKKKLPLHEQKINLILWRTKLKHHFKIH